MRKEPSMALTILQKQMIYHLKRHYATEDEILGIGLLLKSSLMQEEMVTFLMNNPTATPRECVDKAVKICKTEE